MKKSAILFSLFLIPTLFFAQGYRTAAGLRIGTNQGSGIAASVNQKLWNRASAEAIFQPSFSQNDFSLHLLYKQHQKVLFDQLNIFAGGGLHHSFRSKSHELSQKATSGFSGMIGAEVTINKVNVSWDFLPTLNLVGGRVHFMQSSAVTLRMVIVPKKKKEINWKFWKKKKSKRDIRKEKREERRNKRKKGDSKSNWKFWEKAP